MQRGKKHLKLWILLSLLMFCLLPVSQANLFASGIAVAPVISAEILSAQKNLPCDLGKPVLTAMDYAAAVKEVEKQIVQKQSSLEIDKLLEKAKELSKDEKYEETVNVATQIIEQKPDSAEAFRLRGRASRELGRMNPALKDLAHSLFLNPKNAQTLFDRGIVYTTLNQFDMALIDYQKSLILNPTEPCTYNNIGWVHEQWGHDDEALTYYNRALKIDPTLTKAIENRSRVMARLGIKETPKP